MPSGMSSAADLSQENGPKSSRARGGEATVGRDVRAVDCGHNETKAVPSNGGEASDSVADAPTTSSNRKNGKVSSVKKDGEENRSRSGRDTEDAKTAKTKSRSV